MARPEYKHIYNSKQWKRLRLYKLRLTPLCEYCDPAKPRPAVEVDHFKAIADGGDPFDLDNLRSACKRCHSQKTAHKEQLKGCDENGMPRAADHWWNEKKSLEPFSQDRHPPLSRELDTPEVPEWD